MIILPNCRNLPIITVLLLFYLCPIFSNPSFKKIPSIRSVEQIDENTLKVSWDIDNYSGDLTRFRIFYSVIGDDNNEYFEWPAQIKRLKNDIIGSNYRSFWKQKSSFDCYNECIKNPICIFAIYKSSKNKLETHHTCFMKTKLNKTIPHINITNGNAAEYVEITEYKNEAILQGLPTNNIGYSFTVVVYNKKVDKWSKESNVFDYNGVYINIDLKYEFRDDGHVLTWERKNGPNDLTISRYNILIWTGDDKDSAEVISLKDEIIKYKFEPDYYRLSDDSVYSESEDDCFIKCLDKPDCVRYVYLKDSDSCFLLTKLDLTKSQMIPKNSIAYTLKRDLNEAQINSLAKNTMYSAQLEFITPYGLSGLSNVLKFKTGENEIVDLYKPKTSTKSLSTKQSVSVIDVDYGEDDGSDENAILPDINQMQTMAPEINKDPIETIAPEINKEPIETPEPEVGKDPIEAITPEINKDLIENVGPAEVGVGETENEIDETVTRFEINVKASQKKKANENFEVECSFTGSSDKMLIWQKKNDENKELNTEITYLETEKMVKNKLIFEKLARSDEGIYSCYQKDAPENFLYVYLNVTDVPTRPVIVNGSILESGTFVKWSFDNDGGRKLTKCIIEWSLDFNNENSPRGSIELKASEFKENNQIVLKDQLEKGSNLRLWLENKNGPSEKSEEFKVVDLKTNHLLDNEKTTIELISEMTNENEILTTQGLNPKLPVAEITNNSTNSSTGDPAKAKVEEKKPKVFSLVLVFAAILFLIICGYILYQCKFGSNNNENNQPVQNPEENNNLIPANQSQN